MSVAVRWLLPDVYKKLINSHVNNLADEYVKIKSGHNEIFIFDSSKMFTTNRNH